MRIGLTVSIFLMVVFQLLFAVTGKAQSIGTEKVTLSLKDEGLETAIKKIEQQSAFRFFYRKKDIGQLAHLNLAPGTRTIEQTLNALLQNTFLTFKQVDNNILLERKGQHTTGEIKGRVVNSLEKNPVVNASVFLDNATIGSTTADDGTFTLSNIKPGKYLLVISIIGFEPYQMAISAENCDKMLPDIEISPQTIVLKEINVNAKTDPDRERNYGWFKDEFLGTSGFAADCKILNPEALDLNYDKETGILTASTTDFLIIENKALGYKIKYLLADFIKITGNKNALKVQFSGSAFFEEMRGTASQEKRWLKRRLEVYEGSAMHFLRSGLNNSFDEEGFRALRIENRPNPKRQPDSVITAKIKFYENLKKLNKRNRDSLAYWKAKPGLQKTFQILQQTPLAQADFIELTSQKGLYALLSNKGALYVIYNKKHHFETNNKLNDWGDPVNKNSTVINFEVPYVLFDKNGGILNPDCVSFIGAWGKNRVAELLPVDYDQAENADAITNTQQNSIETEVSLPQSVSLKAELLKIKTTSDINSEASSAEKLYMHFDKPYYAVDDTIWFKAYLLKASSLFASDKSAIMYVDIANDSSKIVKRYRCPYTAGLAGATSALMKKNLHPVLIQ